MPKMTPTKFWETAATWGSAMTGGDPGACMYGFDEKGLVQTEAHRADCLAWIEGCRKDLAGRPKREAAKLGKELDALVEYLKTAPVEGAMPELDEFTQGYVGAMLWSTNDESNDAGGDPLDDNYSPEHIAPDTLQRMIADCARFQEVYGPLITSDNLNRSSGSVESSAGHDFWLTREGHGAGFWDGDWEEPSASVLTKAAKSFGEFYIEVGDDGFVHGRGGNPEPDPVEGAPEMSRGMTP